MPWKKNFRKTPQRIVRKMETIDSDEVVVGCVKKIRREDILNDNFKHLQIYLDKEGLHHPESIIPPPQQGKYSNWNINGKVVVRKDLLKETHYNYVEAPNWGDPNKGTHMVALPYEKYPRDYIAPRNIAVEIESADKAPFLPYYIIKFQITEVLNRNSNDFEDRLFFCLNLLQENVGAADVQMADVSFNEYTQTLHVSWEILPPGTVEEVITRVFSGIEPTQEEKNTIIERHNFFMSLNPQSLVYGRSGFQRYFGALINDNLVVFENVRYGNAIYIMFENWQELSQKSRIELLSGRFGEQFVRVVHVGNWQNKVRKIIRERLQSS